MSVSRTQYQGIEFSHDVLKSVSELPLENIVSYLDVQDIGRLTSTSRYLRAMLQDELQQHPAKERARACFTEILSDLQSSLTQQYSKINLQGHNIDAEINRVHSIDRKVLTGFILSIFFTVAGTCTLFGAPFMYPNLDDKGLDTEYTLGALGFMVVSAIAPVVLGVRHGELLSRIKIIREVQNATTGLRAQIRNQEQKLKNLDEFTLRIDKLNSTALVESDDAIPNVYTNNTSQSGLFARLKTSILGKNDRNQLSIESRLEEGAVVSASTTSSSIAAHSIFLSVSNDVPNNESQLNEKTPLVRGKVTNL
jgi:hypothetical protein